MESSAPAELLEGIPILLISLPDQDARRKAMISRGIPSAWVDGYFRAIDLRGARQDARLLEEAQASVADSPSIRGLLPTEIGCAQSHRAAACWLAESSHPMALVLEDDILPKQDNWLEATAATAATLLPYARAGNSFICHLGARQDQADAALKRRVVWRGGSPAQGTPDIYLHVDPDRTLWRAHAYLLSQAAARRTQRLESKLLTHADDWGERRRLGLIKELFYTRPPLIGQDEEQPSTIDGDGLQRGATLSVRKRKGMLPRLAGSLRYRTKMAVARGFSRRPFEIFLPSDD